MTATRRQTETLNNAKTVENWFKKTKIRMRTEKKKGGKKKSQAAGNFRLRAPVLSLFDSFHSFRDNLLPPALTRDF